MLRTIKILFYICTLKIRILLILDGVHFFYERKELRIEKDFEWQKWLLSRLERHSVSSCRSCSIDFANKKNNELWLPPTRCYPSADILIGEIKYGSIH